jgi:hypothetical protein
MVWPIPSSQLNFAAGRAFYGQLLPFLGLTVVADTVNTFYCVGGRTGFGIHAPLRNMLDNDFAKARSDYITIAFVLVSALMSMRRMTS